jgi:carboxylesterase
VNEMIMPGAEPFFLPGSQTGVLLIHGFTGTPQSLRYVGEGLNKFGLAVAAPRLAGHGISIERMSRSSACDWIRSAEEGLNELNSKCERVFVAGLSMGGTLSLHLAAKHVSSIKGVIPINAAVQISSSAFAALAYEKNGPLTIMGIGSDIKDPASKELAYPQVPVVCLKEAFALSATTRALLPLIRCPILVIQAREDHVVPPDNAHIIVNRAGSDRIELLWLNDSFHVSTLDHDKDLIVTEIVDFISRQTIA